MYKILCCVFFVSDTISQGFLLCVDELQSTKDNAVEGCEFVYSKRIDLLISCFLCIKKNFLMWLKFKHIFVAWYIVNL